MDAVEPYLPLRQYYQFKEGAWVEYQKPGAIQETKRRGHIIQIDDQYASVIDEQSFTEVRDKMDTEHTTDIRFTVQGQQA